MMKVTNGLAMTDGICRNVIKRPAIDHNSSAKFVSYEPRACEALGDLKYR
jgi:hypothetical protein